jgi:glycosyltransferase involved in cell wall biosynthesis
MKVALIYDRINKWGGAERVLLALHEVFPQAPLYTAVYSPDKAKWAKVFPKVIPSFLQQIPFAKERHELLGTLTPIAFEGFDFSSFDVVVSVTSEAAKGVITKPSTLHICYCLTPTRYLWSGYEDYFKNPVLRFISRPAVSYLRAWDKIAAQRPDRVVAISKAVQKRIKKYHKRDSEVIYPPVDIDFFTQQRTGKNILRKKDGFYLLVGRLVGYKKADLAVKAFNKLGLPLVIVGTGREEVRLRKMAKENIFFAGELTDEKLADYYRKCTALIFPQEEDFGIVAVEVQAAGAPVVAYKAGGALDTVVEGKTGVFFDRQSEKALIGAVEKLKKTRIKKENLVKNAARFSKENFQKQFLRLVENGRG